ncbi:hypothetical protein K439DRAFT_1656272 [Ramaria rubella]|nr:hypothetical protein K439DRAFT_1656272 [Ramaria rubella]
MRFLRVGFVVLAATQVALSATVRRGDSNDALVYLQKRDKNDAVIHPASTIVSPKPQRHISHNPVPALEHAADLGSKLVPNHRAPKRRPSGSDSESEMPPLKHRVKVVQSFHLRKRGSPLAAPVGF